MKRVRPGDRATIPRGPRRILIIKPSSLGDVVHALPTVHRLRERFVDAKISWLINAELAALLAHCPVIDEVIEFPRHDPARLPSLIARLRARQFDLVVDLQGLFRSGLLARLSGAPQRVGLSDSREGARFFHSEIVTVPPCHAVDRYLLVARQLGCHPDRPVEFPLGSSDADRAVVDRWLPDGVPVVLNPMARWPTKIWGDDNFAALIDRLAPGSVALIGSGTEAERMGRIVADRPCHNLAGKLTLPQVAEVYRRCAVVVSNDTGPMHLAVAAGAAVVALFGPTDPLLVGPYGPGHTVIRAPGGEMSRISVDTVHDAVKPFLA